MSYSEEEKATIFNKAGGVCTYCGRQLSFELYGQCQPVPSPVGAWEVDHWRPKSSYADESEADVPDNLWPACCSCNEEKGDKFDGEAFVLGTDHDQDLDERETPKSDSRLSRIISQTAILTTVRSI